MGTIQQRLLGLISVAFLLGVVPMVLPVGSEAQAVQPNSPGKQAGRFVVLGPERYGDSDKDCRLCVTSRTAAKQSGW